MKLQLIRIADRGVLDKERVHMSALVDTTLSYYVVMKSSIVNDKKVDSGGLSSFWFPTVDVKAGDQVILYTKAGTNSIDKTPSGNVNHFFYWGLSEALHKNPDDCVVLVEADGWFTSR